MYILQIIQDSGTITVEIDPPKTVHVVIFE